MSETENVALMKRWFEEVWNQGKIETIHELLAKSAIGFGQREHGRPTRGPEDFVEFATELRTAFPRVQVKINDSFGCQDKVITRWTADLTSPAGKTVTITGMTMVRIENGQIVEGWDSWDQLTMLLELGAVKMVSPQIVGARAS